MKKYQIIYADPPWKYNSKELCGDRMQRTKIKGFDYTWNPVIGCERNCFYCYAKPIAKRFANNFTLYDREWNYQNKYPLLFMHKGYNIHKNYRNFTPQLVERNLYAKFPKKPSKIFVNSMSDIEYWKDEWFEPVFKRIEENPQHEYYFITKGYIYDTYKKRDFPKNSWLGFTITKRSDLIHLDGLRKLDPQKYSRGIKIWYSIKPLLEDIEWKYGLENRTDLKEADLVIIGKMTGRYASKYPCKQEWIDNIVNECKKYNIRYLVKEK